MNRPMTHVEVVTITTSRYNFATSPGGKRMLFLIKLLLSIGALLWLSFNGNAILYGHPVTWNYVYVGLSALVLYLLWKK